MPDPKLTPTKTPEPLTLTILIEYEDGDYCARIAGSTIRVKGTTHAGAIASAVAALVGWQGYFDVGWLLRQFDWAAKQEQREQNAAVLEQTNAGYADLREREKKAPQRRETLREAVGDKVDALASEIERTLKVRHNKAKRSLRK